MRRLLLPCLLSALAACSTARVTPVVPPPAAVVPAPAPEPVPPPVVEAKQPLTREEVRFAWRRMPEAVDVLAGVLAGPDAALREEAVFGLGQLGLNEAVPEARRLKAAAVVRPLVAEAGPLQALAVEALGKSGGASDEAVLAALSRDPSSKVRAESALALFRLRHLKRIPAYSTAAVTALAALSRDTDPETRWRAAYAASRWPERELAEPLKGLLLRDADPRARLFAARALGQLKAEAPVPALQAAARDRDPQVRREAVWALAQASVTFPSAADDVSPHVRAAAAGALRPQDDRLLRRLLADPSPLVRAEAVGALARVDPDGEALRGRAAAEHWFVRSRALSELGPSARPVFEAAVADPDARVASAALESAARSTEPWTSELLERALRDPASPLEVFGAAVDAAKARASAGLFPALAAAWDHPARANAEVAEGLVAAVRAVLEKEPALKTPEWEARLSTPPAAAFWGESEARPAGPARSVILVTERGEIEIQLSPEEAPVHAARFLVSVSSGLYFGTIFHRVVSDFVVQGGDPRGSGWGDAGFNLRDEINRLPFLRGVVGMPKAGPDTGGCQIFITHVPTPHLDGRYTAFGRVTRGLAIVDALQPGDRIERAYIKP